MNGQGLLFPFYRWVNRLRKVKGLAYDHTARKSRVGNWTQVSWGLSQNSAQHQSPLKVPALSLHAVARAPSPWHSTWAILPPAFLTWSQVSRPLKLLSYSLTLACFLEPRFQLWPSVGQSEANKGWRNATQPLPGESGQSPGFDVKYKSQLYNLPMGALGKA